MRFLRAAVFAARGNAIRNTFISAYRIDGLK